MDLAPISWEGVGSGVSVLAHSNDVEDCLAR